MCARLLIAFALGVVGGGVVLFFATAQRKVEFPHAVTGPETVRVLVAKRELNYGMVLTPKDLQWVEWPKATVPPGSFTSVEALLGEKGNKKRVVLRTIEPGAPILTDRITKMGKMPPMSTNFPNGKRTVTINVDASAGVASFVAPGDRVDIMLIRSIEGKLVNSIIMQDVPVIAIYERPSTETTGARTFRMVSVEVDIAAAQKLALAQQVGRLSLTLSDLGESVESDIKPVTAGELNDYFKSENPSIRVRIRGDFGVPRGLCERPPTAAPGKTPCDVMDFPPWTQ